jgi:hypothetical protein
MTTGMVMRSLIRFIVISRSSRISINFIMSRRRSSLQTAPECSALTPNRLTITAGFRPEILAYYSSLNQTPWSDCISLVGVVGADHNNLMVSVIVL